MAKYQYILEKSSENHFYHEYEEKDINYTSYEVVSSLLPKIETSYDYDDAMWIDGEVAELLLRDEAYSIYAVREVE